MKSNSRRAQRRKDEHQVDAYMEEHYGEIVYEAIRDNAPFVVKQTVAEFLWALSMHGYGRKRLAEIYEWFIGMDSLPHSIMGKTLDAPQIMDLMRDRYGIDFDRIGTTYPSYEEFLRMQEEENADR